MEVNAIQPSEIPLLVLSLFGESPWKIDGLVMKV